MEKKWFGREPALWIQTLSALLAVFVGFGLTSLTDSLAAAIIAVATAGAGVWTAMHVRPVAPSLWTGLIGAGAALAAEFGMHLTQQQVSLVVAATTTLMVLITRAQLTPAHDPRPLSGSRLP